jgi:hypothetical protein
MVDIAFSVNGKYLLQITGGSIVNLVIIAAVQVDLRFRLFWTCLVHWRS